jgi:hypothetical protein
MPLRVGLDVEGRLFTLPITGTLDTNETVFALDGAWLAGAVLIGGDVSRRPHRGAGRSAPRR